ncbi:flavin reductase family protein [Actinocorallia longicatena]|uniref:Flavin reductase family protein n=1 Tax=Actinocorallia longicatena TaxID=111803 RepID=A0ABP6Q770_9ACTN
MSSPASADDSADDFVDGFDYPVLVVTTVDPGTGHRAGCLVGFSTQASIDPFRYLVCLSRSNHTFEVARGARHLAVHVLDRDDPDQREPAELFGTRTGDEIDKFARCAWRPGPAGVPLLTGASRRLAGRILDRFDLGDHVGFLLEPVQVEGDSAADPLGFHGVEDLEPGHPSG